MNKRPRIQIPRNNHPKSLRQDCKEACLDLLGFFFMLSLPIGVVWLVDFLINVVLF
jgi:hypothetical protein